MDKHMHLCVGQCVQCLCVCMCVRVSERETHRERETEGEPRGLTAPAVITRWIEC